MSRRTPRGSTSAPGRRPASRGAVAGLVGLVLSLLVGAPAGLAGALLAAGLYVTVCGLWAVVSRRTWVGRTTRRTAAGVLAGGLVLVVLGAAVAQPVGDVPSPATAAAPAPTSSPVPGPRATPAVPDPPVAPAEPAPAEPAPAPRARDAVPADPSAAAPGPLTALAAAATLTVKGRAPTTGYDRDLFGAGWVDVDRNGCDTRNDVLARDLVGTTSRPGTRDCVVLSGTLADPYSGTTIAFVRGDTTSTAVQVDHVVALSDAWQKGAQGWDTARRTAFANDPMNLLAVDGALNRQKGAGDTATWLPPHQPFRCAYVARQVGVKLTYGLWATDAEQRAMVGVLSDCPVEPLPVGAGVTAAAVAPAAEPAPATGVTDPQAASPTDPQAASPTDQQPAAAPTVPYPSCSAARAAGATPVLVGDPGYAAHLDGDGDGVGCE